MPRETAVAGVVRSSVEALAERFPLPEGAPERLARLLEALYAEPDPPTAICDPRRAVDLHLADSLAGLAIEELTGAAQVADVGSGAGFPGLPLAIALPRVRVDLVEASRRTCELLGRLIAAAGAGNARPVALRAEEWAAGEGREAYGAVTARAVGPLAVLLEYAAPLLARDGVLVAWKGARREPEERAAARAAAELGMAPVRVVAVAPFAGARNLHLHVYAKLAPTPERFPRRPGIARKRPLGR